MSDEIKEILEDLGNKDKYIEEFGCQYKRISQYDSFQLLDYITNLQQENKQLKEKIKWKPIDEYFENKQKYDWVLVKYYDKYNFECIPSVAEYRFGKWYLKDSEEALEDFEIKYFFDMQKLEGDSNE